MEEEYGNILAGQDEREGDRFEDGTEKDPDNADHFPHPF